MPVNGIALVFLLLAGLSAAAAELPPGLPGVELGMTKDALLSSRPAIQKKNLAGTAINFARKDLSLNEQLGAEAWPFRHARYDVTGGRLVGVLLSGYPEPEELRAARLKASASAKALWGDGYAAELVASPHNVVSVSPVLVWEKEGRGVRLTLPPDVPAKSRQSSVIALDVRLAANRSFPESDVVLPAAQRAQLLEQCGVEDRRPPGPADLGVDELRAAPESVVLDGRTVVLRVELRRDYGGLRPPTDGRPMTAHFILFANDGRPFPTGVRMERAWVRRGRELWRIPALEDDSSIPRNAAAPELRASAEGGPRWPALTADAVVRLIDRDGRAVLLGARKQSIVALGRD